MSTSRPGLEGAPLLEEDQRFVIGEAQLPQQVRLNWAQKILHAGITYTTVAAAGTTGTMIVRDTYGLKLDAPMNGVMTVMTVVVAKEFMAGMNALTRKSHPADYLRAEGDGNAGKGFQNELGRGVVATLIPLGAGAGLSIGSQKLYEWGLEQLPEHLDLVIALNYFDTAAMHALVYTAITLGGYEGMKLILDKCISRRKDIPHEERPSLNWAQYTGGAIWAAFTATYFHEAVGEAIRTNTGPMWILERPEFIAFGVPAVCLVGDILTHASWVPRPFVNIRVPECQSAEQANNQHSNDDLLDDEDDVVELERQDPTKCRQLGNLSIKLLIAGAVFTTVSLSALKIMQVAGGSTPENNDQQNGNFTTSANMTTSGQLTVAPEPVVNPNEWDMWVRVGAEGAVALAYFTVKGLLNGGVSLLAGARNWCSGRGLFGGRQHEEAARQQQSNNPFDDDQDHITGNFL